MNIITIVFVIPAFPSPAGVNYYESNNIIVECLVFIFLFPSPAGVNYYEFIKVETFDGGVHISKFPSPAGVNYYELLLGGDER